MKFLRFVCYILFFCCFCGVHLLINTFRIQEWTFVSSIFFHVKLDTHKQSINSYFFQNIRMPQAMRSKLHPSLFERQLFLYLALNLYACAILFFPSKTKKKLSHFQSTSVFNLRILIKLNKFDSISKTNKQVRSIQFRYSLIKSYLDFEKRQS